MPKWEVKMTPPNTPPSDPELAEIDELAAIERTRPIGQDARSRRSTLLIASVVLLLVILGVGSAWIAGVP